ncbi:MAG TPA: response regulator [Patescibacteria group bacterium]|nr:response regulator [Patescibacteria group bacterium]
MNNRILVADDDPEVRDYLSQVFRGVYNVNAVDVNSAVMHCKMQGYYLLMIGDEAESVDKVAAKIQEIRKSRPDIRIAWMTTSTISVEQAEEIGTTIVIYKPIDTNSKVVINTVALLMEQGGDDV